MSGIISGVLKIFISLLPLVFGEYKEMKLISELNNFFNFDHNIFLLDSTVNINRFVNTTEFTPKSLFILKGVDYMNVSVILKNITSKNTFLVVVPATTDFDNNDTFLGQAWLIKKLKVDMKIGIFFTEFASNEVLGKLFRWCKELNLFNVFATTYPKVIEASRTESSLNSFTFHPFGEISVLNVTGCSYKLYFASFNSNFHRHRLNVSNAHESSAEKLWEVVFDMMNATSLVVNTGEMTQVKTFKLGIDVSKRIRAQGKVPNFNVYPIKMEPQIILVPQSLPYSGFSAYLQTVTSDEFFAYSLLAIAAVMLLLSIFRYVKQKRILFFQSVVDVLNLLMNDNLSIKYQHLSRIEVFLIVPLTFVGFVAVNGILSTLRSYLTRPVYQPQIRTLEDIYRSQLPIMTFTVGWKRDLTAALIKETTFLDWDNKIFTQDLNAFKQNFYSFNTSATFLSDLTFAGPVLSTQKRWSIRGYYVIAIKRLTSYRAFHVSNRFPFVDRLNDIIHRIKSAALYQPWLQQQFAEREQLILKSYLLRLKTEPTKDVSTFEFPMFIVYGWLASVVLFVLEIIWKLFGKILNCRLARYILETCNCIYCINKNFGSIKKL